MGLRKRGIGWRGRWEGGSGWGIHVNPWLIHVNVWQKPLQYCKVISLQLIKINGKKKSWIQLSSWAEQTTLVDFQGAGRCCCWIAKSCPALHNPVDCSMPGLHVSHYLPETAGTNPDNANLLKWYISLLSRVYFLMIENFLLKCYGIRL